MTSEDSSVPIRVYRPNQRHELGFFQTWRVMVGNVVRSRELIWQLFKRDFFAAYKKSFIGIAWILVAPVVSILSWVFLQGTGILNPGETGVPYPAYVLVGTLMWGLFLGFYQAAMQTLSAGQSLVMQVNYPHEALLFKQTAQHLAQFLLAFALNMVVLALLGVVPSWKTIFLPLVALPLFLLGGAVGLVVSMIAIVAVDIEKIVTMALGLMLWLTPVVYSSTIDNQIVQTLIRWNPLTYLVCSARDIVLYGRLYEAKGYFLCAGLALVLFLVSWRLFYVSEDKIIERMI